MVDDGHLERSEILDLIDLNPRVARESMVDIIEERVIGEEQEVIEIDETELFFEQ